VLQFVPLTLHLHAKGYGSFGQSGKAKAVAIGPLGGDSQTGVDLGFDKVDGLFQAFYESDDQLAFMGLG
jgi:hypothetical protein